MENLCDIIKAKMGKKERKMPTIKIKVQDKIATNLTPNQKIVCGNEDYKVEFEFDNQWNNAEAKTALFIYNGGAIVEPFLGNVCKVPILQNTELLTVGVKTDDGLLYTSTGAKVFCLYSASDLANVEIPAPSKDVYDQIIELINNKIIGENLPYEELPLMDGIAQSGESSRYARGDHRHPTDENLKAIAENAEKIAQSAQENINLSVEKAESALGKATLANETAISAKELSETANENAQQALNTANEAKDLIGGAEKKANTALEKANEVNLQIPYFGTTLEVSLDQSTYLLTAKLFNKEGVALSTQTIDLPLETMVVGGLTEEQVDEKIAQAIGGIENGTY